MPETNNKNQTACSLSRLQNKLAKCNQYIKTFYLWIFFFTAAHLRKLDKDVVKIHYFASHLVDWNVKKKMS